MIFGDDPTVIIPVNAAVHATSGLLIFLIGCILWPGKVGKFSGIIGGSLFILFPSSLNWYAQIHKDGFAILGILIIFYSWFKGLEHNSKLKSGLWILFGSMIGVAFVIFVRPYNVKLLIVATLLVLLFVFFYFLALKSLKNHFHIIMYLIALILILIFIAINKNVPKSALLEDTASLVSVQNTGWKWKSSKMIPENIDHLIKSVAELRVHNILYGEKMKAGSLIDENERPDSIWSVIAYLPRAAQIAYFAPFPDKWFQDKSITRVVSTAETIIWYLFVPGLLLAFAYRNSMLQFIIIMNASFFLTVYGYIIPNIGTLYRIRYLYLLLVMLMGITGWVELIRRRYGKKMQKIQLQKGDEPEPYFMGITEAFESQSRSTVAASGGLVIIFTLLSNILFVTRDIILARWFGLGNELDAFFISLIVPMFFVTVLSIPIGTIMVPSLLHFLKDDHHAKVQQLITICSTMIFIGMIILCLGLFACSGFYLPVLALGFTAEKITQSYMLQIFAFPILFFSGFVILGNSILNARQKFALPALIQSVVPILAILSLLVFAKWIGIYAMALGMGIGQLVNLFIVGYYVHKEGYSIFPRMTKDVLFLIKKSSQYLATLLSQYIPLIFSSFFVSLALPVNNFMAASLHSGSVSAFGLGTKFVLFFTGLVGTGISTVMLPYFSSFFVRNRIMDARHELSFFLFLGTAIPIPLTVIVYFLTGFVVKIVFGGAFTIDDISTVTRVIEYGIIQLPFFCTNMLFAKYANAKQKNTLIMVSSLLGLTLNIILNFIFITRMGVGGIALASSLSLMAATMLFLIVGHRYNDVNLVDVVFIILTWLLFLTILLCQHFKSMSGVIIASGSLILTIAYHFVQFFHYTRIAEKISSE